MRVVPASIAHLQRARPTERLSRLAGAVSRSYWFVHRFIRFSAFSYTAILPLLGAASVSPGLTPRQLVGLLAIAATFHAFAYVLNDVVDLAVDQLQPLRAEYPLVRGSISPGLALTIALTQVPIGLLVSAWLRAEVYPALLLIGAYVLMALYDLYGKRIAMPPATDLIQGLAWGALVLYGAAAVGGPANQLTGSVFAFVVFYTMLINGVHGSLRDLANDLACGARSTALMLGARPRNPTGDGGIVIPRRLVLYALTLQLATVGITAIPLAMNTLRLKATAWMMTVLLVAVLGALSVFTLLACIRTTTDKSRMMAGGMLHLVVSMSALMALFVAYVEPLVLITLILVFLLPLLANSWFYDALTLKWWRDRT